MCNFVSGYATQHRGLRCNPFLTSHEDQIAFFNDADLDVKETIEIVRWELTPPVDLTLFWDVENWNFKIDEVKVPYCADVRLIEYDARKCVKEHLSACPNVPKDTFKPILVDRIFAIRGEGTVGKLCNSFIMFLPDKTTIRYAEGSTIVNAGR